MSFQSPAAQFDAVIAAVAAMSQQQVIAEAKRLHADVMNSDPKPINFVRHVDGVEAPEEALKPGGVIVYDYNRLDLIAKDALKLLRENSPVGSGRDPHPGDYRDSHCLYLNTQKVTDLSNWHPGDEVSITSTLPYARVIEIGKPGAAASARAAREKKGGGAIKVGYHVYEKVAQALRREYAGTAFIEFTYRAVLSGGQVDQAAQGATPLARNRKSGRFVNRGGIRAHNASDVRWPTIVIHPNSDRP